MEAAAKPALQPTPRETATMQFQYLDLKAQYETIRGEVMEAIARVMESQHFILGSEVEQLEAEIAKKLGARHAVSCASGSDALVLALMAAGIGPGDEVVTSPFTFIATAGSIARVGATPVFVDIDRESFNLLPEAVAAAITPRTRAIMPVHLFGLAADMDPVLRLAKDLSLFVVEDAAQAIGASYKGRTVGLLGDFGCFSFFPSKNLGGAGDGGLVTTDDPAMAEKLRMLRVHGSKRKYHHDILGTNSRLDALQAAILRVKLPHLDFWTRARQLRAQRYRDLFRSAGFSERVRVPPAPAADYRHVYNQFTVRCESRDALKEYVRRAGVPTEIYYPLPLHLQPAFSRLGYRPGQLPEAEAASREVLSLPVYPELADWQQESVVRSISDFYAKQSA
ncbi:MAG TPA: DegT/DnrJ/EryC1/StrS family aminotransferase [Verrucomicrobiae bacterium]|nr:DegT/DnrJ/EryC1/StrS family aminotransferase [Verrucomicrobiae bacterium]